MEMPVLTGGVQIPEYPGDHFHYVLAKILMAGRANGLKVIDGPYLKIREGDALRDYCRRAHTLGCGDAERTGRIRGPLGGRAIARRSLHRQSCRRSLTRAQPGDARRC